jgi:hypothetical protein
MPRTGVRSSDVNEDERELVADCDVSVFASVGVDAFVDIALDDFDACRMHVLTILIVDFCNIIHTCGLECCDTTASLFPALFFSAMSKHQNWKKSLQHSPKDSLYDLVKVLAQTLGSAERAFFEIQLMIEEHRRDPITSRLSRACDVSAFFTDLPLVEAFRRYDKGERRTR